jgi:hypothetical protein
MNNRSSPNVDLGKYPELKVLCWDISNGAVSRRHAVSLYIDRWKHVNEKRLSSSEKSLIQSLTDEYGRGMFFPRSHGRSDVEGLFAEVTISTQDIEEQYLDQFQNSIEDLFYPGMRNGTLYFWRSDYEKFISQLKIIESSDA